MSHDLRWSTTDSAVARVSAAGLVTAVATGKAQITATSVATPAVSASAAVTVAGRRVAALVVTPKDITVHAGATL